MNLPRIITKAERAARNGQSGTAAPKRVAWHKKNPDGTRCPTCKPIITTVRTV